VERREHCAPSGRENALRVVPIPYRCHLENCNGGESNCYGEGCNSHIIYHTEHYAKKKTNCNPRNNNNYRKPNHFRFFGSSILKIFSDFDTLGPLPPADGFRPEGGITRGRGPVSQEEGHRGGGPAPSAW